MATTTPNFGWTVPTSSDLVKNGATAIETLGDAIDASLVDLKGGTTNQVLAKNSNTDMDFKWVADASGIPATIIDAKGDLIAGTAADTAARLAVGTNGQVLTADSAEATGLKWATPAAGGGGKVLQVVYVNYSTATTNTTTSYADTGLSATITPTSATSKVLVLINQKSYVARSGINAGLAIQLLKGASAIYTPDTGGNNGLYTRATGATIMEIQAGVVLEYLDSPATTSATTYKTQARCYQAGETVTTQEGSSISSITLMEIGA